MSRPISAGILLCFTLCVLVGLAAGSEDLPRRSLLQWNGRQAVGWLTSRLQQRQPGRGQQPQRPQQRPPNGNPNNNGNRGGQQWRGGSRPGNPAPARWSGSNGNQGRQDPAVYRQRLQGMVQPAVNSARRYGRRNFQASSPWGQRVAKDIQQGNAAAAASTVAAAVDQNPDYAAQGFAAAAAAGARSSAAADAFAQCASLRPAAASSVYARSAAMAVGAGHGDAFSQSVAEAFGISKRRRELPQFTKAVADAIAQSGSDGQYAYGQAIAKAVAGGGDSRAAVAEATATAMCAGGSQATAWASAYAIALSINNDGCLVLNEARALAVARCRGGQFSSESKTSATSTVLGFCGMLSSEGGPGGLPWGGNGFGGGYLPGGRNSYGGGGRLERFKSDDEGDDYDDEDGEEWDGRGYGQGWGHK